MVNNPNFDLYIDEGADFSIYLELSNMVTDEFGTKTEVPVNLSSIINISAKVKKDFLDTSPVILSFNATVTNAVNGEIGLALTKLQTTNLYSGSLATSNIGYYDIILQSATGSISKLVSGRVFVNQSISI